ncbi:hypothetical protein FIM07_04220 [SAR202 cluster bacterium AD-802-F09_MRT_200m]|nr:hypothetical protein [SAR202 cluster bacterium AD-802-F09_MRT_200m]
MRYLSSISLALIVHVLLSIVGLMILACASTPAATPTPSGPMYSKAEAMAVLKEHLQTKIFPGEPYPCLLVIEDNIRNPNSITWEANYDNDGRLWNVTATRAADGGAWAESLFKTPGPPASPAQWEAKHYTWSVYERTGSIVATGDDPINQMC